MEDLDDLFTDQLHDQLDEQLNDQINAQLEMSTAQAPPPGLAERLDELRLNGCSQKIAWSRMGAIAYITSDSRDVKICCLQFKENKGSWGMSEYTDRNFREFTSRFYRGYDFTHITWNPHGTDLLIIDSSGRIAVAIVFIALNRLIIAKVLNGDPEDNLNAVVGSKWLDMKRRISFPHGAEKVEGVWKYNCSQYEAKGPWSPFQKSAFVIVTRGASIKLFYHGMNDWSEVKAEVDGISSSEDMLTHADFCSDKDDHLLLAVHNASRVLKLYNIRIDWQMPTKAGDSSVNSTTLSVYHITTLDVCRPSLNLPNFNSVSVQGQQEDLELSHLKLLPHPPDDASAVPVVLGIFSRMSAMDTGVSSVESLLSRWELREEKPMIDPIFMTLSTKKTPSTELKEEHVLNKIDDIRVERLLVFLEQIHSGSNFAFGYSDGDIEFRDRSMSIQPVEDRPDRASTLMGMGFTFDRLEPSLHMALSPHGCVKTTFGKVRECKISYLNLPVGLAALDTLDKVTASFVLQHTVSEMSFNMGNNPTDDLLMTMWHFGQQYLAPQRREMEINFMKDLYRTLNFLDKCADPNTDRLLRFVPLGRALSMQGAVGSQSEPTTRWSLTSKVAFTLQSLRLIALSLSFAIIPKSGQAATGGSADLDINRPETLSYITTQVGWMITLVDYILDQLFEVNRLFGTSDQLDVNILLDKASEPYYPCLILILCTVTRNYIRYSCKGLRNIPPLFQLPAAIPPSPLAPLYAILSTTIRGCVIPPSDLEAVLEATDQQLQEVYGTLSEAQRQDVEMQLLAAGEIPPVLLPALQKILSGVVEGARQRAGDSEAELAFKDWSAVSLSKESEEKKPSKKDRVFDGVRKAEMKKGKVRTRVCLRCGGHMEDLIPSRNQKGWMWNMMRTCYCGGHWVVEKPKEGA